MRWDEVLGGGMGPPEERAGVVMAEPAETAGDAWACGVVGVLGDAPLPLGRREGFREDDGEGCAGGCWG